MLHRSYLLILITLGISFHISFQIQLQDTSNRPECFSNKNIWKIYSKHFTFANTVTIKFLTIGNYKKNEMNDAATTILHNMLSFVPTKTVKVQKISIKWKVHIKENHTSPELRRSRVKRNSHLLNKYKIFKLSSEPEQAYVIVVWNEEVLYHYLEETSSFVFPKSRALYVILLVSQQSNAVNVSKDIGSMLKMMWEKFNIFNVIVQTICSSNSNDIYIYKPFKNTRTGRGLVEIIEIEEILADEYLIVNQLRHMNGTPLNISLFQREPTSTLVIPAMIANYSIHKYAKKVTGFYGLDANILAEISRLLNFKIVINYNPNIYYGMVLANGSIIGSLGQVVRKEVLLSANGRFVGDYGTSDIEFTTAINSDQICFIVPKSQRKPQWLSIFHGFKLSVWLLMVAVLLISIGIWYLYQNIYRKPDLCKTCLEMYSICLSFPVSISTNGVRSLFLGTIMLSNLIINGIFQGNLIYSFSKSAYFPDINTMQELADSNLKILTSLNLSQEHRSEAYTEIQSKVYCCGDKMSAMDKAAYFRTWAAIERKSDAKLLLETKYTNELGEPLLHIMNECIYTAFLAYIVPKGSPFLPKFNFIIQMLLEGGLIEKWSNDIVEAIVTEKRLNMRNSKYDTPRKLTPRDLQFAFFLILAGYVTSAVIFLIEVMRK